MKSYLWLTISMVEQMFLKNSYNSIAVVTGVTKLS